MEIRRNERSKTVKAIYLGLSKLLKLLEKLAVDNEQTADSNKLPQNVPEL